MVALLKHELLKRGKIPFYGTSVSNINSKNVAINAGFFPVWAEVYSKNYSPKKICYVIDYSIHYLSDYIKSVGFARIEVITTIHGMFLIFLYKHKDDTVFEIFISNTVSFYFDKTLKALDYQGL